MNPLSSALTQGFSNDSILQYLLRHFPHARRQIERAVAQGFGADKIIKYLQGGRQEVNKSGPMTEHEQTRAGDIARKKDIKKNIGKGALALGATALGGYALSRALPRASTALQGELLPAESQALQLPNQAQRLGLPGPQQSMAQAPPTSPPPQSPISPTGQPSTPTPSQPIEVTVPELPPLLQELAKRGFDSGNDIDNVSGLLEFSQPKAVKDYEKTHKIPIARAVEEFSKQLPAKPMETKQPIQQSAAQGPAPSVSTPQMEERLQSEREQIEEPKKEKGSTVALPNGDIGEIKDVRQGIATIESNGKEYRRKMDELIQPPIPIKDLAELHDELLKGIEEKTGEEVSRMANWVGYDENNKSLAFQPHGPNSKFYVYDDISDEEAKELKSIEAMRRTTGQNYIGVWKQGTKSVVGNKLYDLIKKIQIARGGKGKEYSYRFDSIYDALEPAKRASKEKHEKEKNEKRKTKKPRTN
jgi:hypothetical protein